MCISVYIICIIIISVGRVRNLLEGCLILLLLLLYGQVIGGGVYIIKSLLLLHVYELILVHIKETGVHRHRVEIHHVHLVHIIIILLGLLIIIIILLIIVEIVRNLVLRGTQHLLFAQIHVGKIVEDPGLLRSVLENLYHFFATLFYFFIYLCIYII